MSWLHRSFHLDDSGRTLPLSHGVHLKLLQYNSETLYMEANIHNFGGFFTRLKTCSIILYKISNQCREGENSYGFAYVIRPIPMLIPNGDNKQSNENVLMHHIDLYVMLDDFFHMISC